jgi:aminoglycoside phosphotransferase family enzyme
MFDRLIHEGSWQPADLQALSRHLKAFYAQSPVLRLSGQEYCGRLAAGVSSNLEELLAAESFGVDAARVAEIARLQQRWIDVHGAMLTLRAEQGMIRDCHGDLKPEHVYFGPPVCVIDRLEFDAELRALDPIEDLCFLWLECARLGAPAAGEWLVRNYQAASGSEAPSVLADFYLSQRALTRAKVAAWRLIMPGADSTRWQARVADYLSRALAAVRPAD